MVLLLVPALLAGCVVYEREHRVPPVNPVSVEGVIAMVRARVNEWQIVGEIRTNGVLRTPSTDDIVAMKQAGASDAVIRAMIDAPVMAPRKEEVYREVYYDTRPAENTVFFGLGAVVGYTLFHGGHGHYYSNGYRYRGCGRW